VLSFFGGVGEIIAAAEKEKSPHLCGLAWRELGSIPRSHRMCGGIVGGIGGIGSLKANSDGRLKCRRPTINLF